MDTLINTETPGQFSQEAGRGAPVPPEKHLSPSTINTLAQTKRTAYPFVILTLQLGNVPTES